MKIQTFQALITASFIVIMKILYKSEDIKLHQFIALISLTLNLIKIELDVFIKKYRMMDWYLIINFFNFMEFISLLLSLFWCTMASNLFYNFGLGSFSCLRAMPCLFAIINALTWSYSGLNDP